MRVKVGDKWYKVEKGQPIMLELEKQDIENIKNMIGKYYACFSDEEEMNDKEKREWMKGEVALDNDKESKIDNQKYTDEIIKSVNENVTGEGEPCDVDEESIRKTVKEQIRKAQLDVLNEIHFEALTSAKKEPERLGMLVAKAFFKKKNQLKEEEDE